MGAYGNAKHIALKTIHLVMVSGMIVMLAFIIWKGLQSFTGCESPAQVLISGNMEPAVRKGDIIFCHNGNSPIQTGDMVFFRVEGQEIPILHRVIKVNENVETGDFEYLTKGDSNIKDDRVLYPHNQLWLQRDQIIGRAVGPVLPYVGRFTLFMMADVSHIKYLLLGVFLGLLA